MYAAAILVSHLGTPTWRQKFQNLNYTKKLSMYVGPHDVYPTIDVNFSILTRECKNKKLVDNIFSSNFVLLSMRWIIKLL